MSKYLTATMPAVVAAAAAAALVLCAAAGAGSALAPSPSPAASWHAAMQCVRSHGYPSLRDPQIDSGGQENFGTQGLAVKQALGDRRIAAACKTYLEKIPRPGRKVPPTPAEVHQLVLFAQCIRRHGTPDWPDPNRDGAFPLPSRILNQGKPGFLRMSAKCKSVWNKGIAIEGPPSGP
jgi:hypothetical protein